MHLCRPCPSFKSPRQAACISSPLCHAQMASEMTEYASLQAVRTLRATQLESIFGLDCVVPNSQGAARMAAWWSPSRKEAMLELRLL